MAKKNSGDPKVFAYEVFMAQARKEGRVRNEELSMKVLKPDLSLQARVNHIDVDHVRALHDILKNGQQLAPIIVFEIEELKGKATVKTFKIADGFHRHEVYKREGLPGIPCVVVAGTLQEAIEYAASANQTLSLKRSREDIRKAVWLLLDNGWFKKSSPQIAKQVGASQPTVDKHRASYCTSKGIKSPDTVVDVDGKERRKRRKLCDDYRLIERSNHGRPGNGPTKDYRVNAGGKMLYLGTDKEVAERKLRDLNADREAGLVRAAVKFSDIRQASASRGVGLTPVSSAQDTALHFVSGYRLPGVAVAVWEDGRSSDLLRAVGSVTLIASHFGLSRKVLVKKQTDHAFDSLTDVAKKAGIEFMTLDEFVAAVKADQPAAVPSAVTA